MTLECRFRARSYPKRAALVAKTESSEYGIFVGAGIPYFTIFLDEAYVEPKSDGTKLQLDTWHHIAGVFDGKEVRTYLDGQLIAQQEATGVRKTNGLPLIIGGDVDRRGLPTSNFDGEIDVVRLSSKAKYKGESFEVPDEIVPQSGTLLLLDCDRSIGPFVPDSSREEAHAMIVGEPQLVPVE